MHRTQFGTFAVHHPQHGIGSGENLLSAALSTDADRTTSGKDRSDVDGSTDHCTYIDSSVGRSRNTGNAEPISLGQAEADGLVGICPHLEAAAVVAIQQLGTRKGGVFGDSIDLRAQLIHFLLQSLAVLGGVGAVG
ncbi:hypothetical protein D3C77_556990 [compost metagenome]